MSGVTGGEAIRIPVRQSMPRHSYSGLIGLFPKCTTNEPITPPIKIPRPTKIISVWLVGRCSIPQSRSRSIYLHLGALPVRGISPGPVCVAANTGILTPARLILLMLTPCITFSLRRPATVLPENFLREISTGNVSAGKSSNSRSFTSVLRSNLLLRSQIHDDHSTRLRSLSEASGPVPRHIPHY